MATYDDWNRALVLFSTQGTPRGTKIYLSVDDDLVNEIGYTSSLSLTEDNWTQDFRVAIQRQVVRGDHIDLSDLKESTQYNIPKCVAFLGATVLAAYQMGERQISDKNYFTQLRQVLGLPTDIDGRPTGMEQGCSSEQPLWNKWNSWLQENGYLASAQPGEGPKTYINYPISQSILRYTDKRKLKRLFHDNGWKKDWQKETLMSYIRQKASDLSKHIKGLLSGSKHSYNAISTAIYQVYEDWLENGLEIAQSSNNNYKITQKQNRKLSVDIYRTEEYFTAEINYYIYPKQSRRLMGDQIKVIFEDDTQMLMNERSGWYQPTSRIGIDELTKGAKYQVVSPNEVNLLMLPQRDFWILIQDPDEESSAYAPWDSPRLGETFILLCKQELQEDLTRLRTENLFKWTETIEPFYDRSDWLEFHNCMILSQDWDDVIINNQELKEALQPRDYLSINLSGGLRLPKMGAWLEGQEPLVTIAGFYPQANLKIVYLPKDKTILDETYSTNKPISVEWAGAGDYLLKSEYAGEPVERLVKIVDWASLPLEAPKNYYKMELSSALVCGSVITPLSIS